MRLASVKLNNLSSSFSSYGLDHQDVPFSELQKFVVELEPLKVQHFKCNCVSVHAHRVVSSVVESRWIMGRPFTSCLQQGPKPTKVSTVTVASLVED